MLRIVAALLACFLFTASAQAAAPLPADILRSLERAKASGDPFIVGAVKEHALRLYPERRGLIYTLLGLEEPAPSPVETAQAEPKEPSIPDAPEHEWGGSAEFGGKRLSGNSDELDVNGALTLEHSYVQWENDIKTRLLYSRTDGVTDDEEYELKGNSKYFYSERNYVFGRAQFISDRFEGYDYRISEIAGLGRRFIDEEDLTLDLEAGIGMQHQKPGDGDIEHAPRQELAAHLDWNVWDGIDLTNDTSLSRGDGDYILESDTALKTRIYEAWHFKAGFLVDYISDAPDGATSTDTTTTANIVYEF